MINLTSTLILPLVWWYAQVVVLDDSKLIIITGCKKYNLVYVVYRKVGFLISATFPSSSRLLSAGLR